MTMETQIQGAHLFFGLSVWTSGRGCQEIPSPRLTARTWKCMARILVCFRDGIFWGAMLVSWRVVLPSFSHSGPKWYNCVVASKGSDFLSQLVYVLVLFVLNLGTNPRPWWSWISWFWPPGAGGSVEKSIATTPHAFDAFFFRNCPSEYDMIWMDNFGIRKSTQFPCTSFCYIISILQMFGCNL